MRREQIVLWFALVSFLCGELNAAVPETLLNRFEDLERSEIQNEVEEELRELEDKLQAVDEVQADDESMLEKVRAVNVLEQLPLDKIALPFLPIVRRRCCVPGFTYVDLNNASCAVVNTVPGVEIVSEPRTTGDKKCSKTALLKISFDKLTKEPCDFCLEAPYCGRRMLKIDLDLSPGTRSGFGFNIGDSATNDGYGGDYKTQIRDAESQGRFPNVEVYKSDTCKSGLLKTFSNAMGPAVNHVTLYVSNQYLRVTNDQGFDDSICSNCLYALNGQADSQGINQDIYLGLNRVITGRAVRNGVGVCSATLKWICPKW